MKTWYLYVDNFEEENINLSVVRSNRRKTKHEHNIILSVQKKKKTKNVKRSSVKFAIREWLTTAVI